MDKVPSEVVTEINIAEESEKCTSENGVMPVDGNSCDIGMPYAPENWPCPGDQWSWKVGCRASVTGHWLDRWFTTQINLLIWLRRRNCKIGLITTSSSMREIHQKGPPTRLAFLAVLVLRWMPLNTTKQRLRRLRKKNLMYSQLFQ